MPRSRPSPAGPSSRDPDETSQPLLESDSDEPIITFPDTPRFSDPLAVSFANTRASRNVFDELAPRGGSSADAVSERRRTGFQGASASESAVDRGRSFEMRARNVPGSQGASVSPSNLNPSFVLVDIPIEATDTLPSFAIKYHVTTAELKRLNNLFHDQDFYSRPSLKVPIHKYGILAERYLDPSTATLSAPTLIDLSPASPSPPDEEVTSISVRSLLGAQSREAKLFLQNMDRDLARLTAAAQTVHTRSRSPEPAAEMHLTARQMRVEPLDGLGCDGADLGIPVKVMILMAVVLTVVLPMAFLAYKLYCYHHPGLCPDGGGHEGTGGLQNVTLQP